MFASRDIANLHGTDFSTGLTAAAWMGKSDGKLPLHYAGEIPYPRIIDTRKKFATRVPSKSDTEKMALETRTLFLRFSRVVRGSSGMFRVVRDRSRTSGASSREISRAIARGYRIYRVPRETRMKQSAV